jgi:hypothetical protein
MLDDDARQVVVFARAENGWSIQQRLDGPAYTPPALTVVDGVVNVTFGAAGSSPELRGPVPFTMVATRPLRCEVSSPTSTRR